uniref:Metalloendopeptidase n=1 Tax=Plectus sambesii TaxID=2011161 RepID=A0A914XEV3_9BILA
MDEAKTAFMCEVFAPIACFILPILTSFLLSVGIFRIALRHTKALYRLAREVNPTQSVERSAIYCRKLWRAIMFVLVTTLVSALLLLPYWVAKPIHYFTNDPTDSSSWLALFNDFLGVNAAVDPIITILTQKLYRREVKSWLSCLRMKVSKLRRGDNSSQDEIFPRNVHQKPFDEETSDSGASIESLDINKVLCELNKTRPFSMIILVATIFVIYADAIAAIKGYNSNKNLRVQSKRIRRATKFAEGKDIQWPSNIIYYEKFGIDDDEKMKEVETAMRIWEKETCVRFRPLAIEARSQHPYVLEVQLSINDRCSSGTGVYKFNIFTGQILIAGPKCTTYKIVHELGHTLGLYHEHSRPDRDDFVRINWYNIGNTEKDKTQMDTMVELNTNNQPYDYGSIMHYSAYHKTLRPGGITIEPRNALYRDTIGQRQQISFLDAKEINELYCSDKCRDQVQYCYHGGYTDPNDCRRCKCPEGLGGISCDQLQSSTNGIKFCGGELRAKNDWSFFAFNTTVPATCYWRIATPSNQQRILFFFKSTIFKCPMFEPCSEFVEVKHEADFQPTGYRMCCDRADTKYSIITATNQMLLIFKGPGSFHIQFKTTLTRLKKANKE